VSPSNSVVRTIEVPVDPATAFEAFTEEIGAWYRPGPYSWNHPERALGIRFEPGVGGRLVEVHDEATGEGFEIGRVLVWEPGARLVFGFRSVFFPAGADDGGRSALRPGGPRDQGDARAPRTGPPAPGVRQDVRGKGLGRVHVLVP